MGTSSIPQKKLSERGARVLGVLRAGGFGGGSMNTFSKRPGFEAAVGLAVWSRKIFSQMEEPALMGIGVQEKRLGRWTVRRPLWFGSLGGVEELPVRFPERMPPALAQDGRMMVEQSQMPTMVLAKVPMSSHDRMRQWSERNMMAKTVAR
jgi:hypothetical protein